MKIGHTLERSGCRWKQIVTPGWDRKFRELEPANFFKLTSASGTTDLFTVTWLFSPWSFFFSTVEGSDFSLVEYRVADLLRYRVAVVVFPSW